jgi:acetolactate synthase-1/2/3 large subunit
VLQYVARHNVTFITTPDGKGLINPRHPRFRGVFGFGGHEAAEAELTDPAVDLVVAIGTTMGELNSGGWNKALLNERLVHVDESEENLATTPMAQLQVRGRIRTIFERLAERHHAETNAEASPAQESADLLVASWGPLPMLRECPQFDSNATPITPQRLMKELGQLFPSTTRFLADTGSSLTWATHCLHPTDRRLGERRLKSGEGRRTRSRMQDPGGRRQMTTGTRRQSKGGWLRVTLNFAPMGWAIGAAVGTAMANQEVPVVCITGDGSMLMNGQELSAAVAENLTVIFVVLNDAGLGMVKHGQRMAGSEQIGCDIPATDFAAMARAMGAQAFTIRSPDDMATLPIDEICARKGPTLLDVHIDPEEPPPMGLRVKVLNAAQ